jgi:hypothetical protein
MYAVTNRVVKAGLTGTVTEIDEAGSIRVQWDDEKEGATWEQEGDILPHVDNEVKEVPVAVETKPKRTRKAKAVEKPVTCETPDADAETASEPVVVAKDAQVKLTGRIRNEASKYFVTLMADSGSFRLVQDRTYQAVNDVTKHAWKTLVKGAKKVGLGLEIIEVKEPKKRLSPKERARQNEIAARRLAQLAAARKNLAKKRSEPKEAPVSAEAVLEGETSEPAVTNDVDPNLGMGDESVAA